MVLVSFFAVTNQLQLQYRIYGTVYEFDVKKLRELCASKANMVDHGSNSDGHGPMISQINGRTLLLFYYGNVNMGYQIVTCC